MSNERILVRFNELKDGQKFWFAQQPHCNTGVEDIARIKVVASAPGLTEIHLWRRQFSTKCFPTSSECVYIDAPSPPPMTLGDLAVGTWFTTTIGLRYIKIVAVDVRDRDRDREGRIQRHNVISLNTGEASWMNRSVIVKRIDLCG